MLSTLSPDPFGAQRHLADAQLDRLGLPVKVSSQTEFTPHIGLTGDGRLALLRQPSPFGLS